MYIGNIDPSAFKDPHETSAEGSLRPAVASLGVNAAHHALPGFYLANNPASVEAARAFYAPQLDRQSPSSYSNNPFEYWHS